MSKTKVPSFAYQISELFRSGLAIGSSRHITKLEMTSEGRDPRAMADQIHSYGTWHTEMKNAITIFKDVKAIEGSTAKYVADVTLDMIRRCFQAYRARGLSANTLAARLTALRRLEKLSGFKLVPDDLKAPRTFSPRGAYSVAEAQTIIEQIEKCNPHVALILALQATAALRLKEAVWVSNALMRDRRTGTDRPGIDRSNGTVFIEGKGGKQREVRLLDKNILNKINPVPRFPLRTTQTERTQFRRIQAAIKQACRELDITYHGTHGLRAMAAEEFLARRLAAGIQERQARHELAQWLGHNRTGVLRHYVAAR